MMPATGRRTLLLLFTHPVVVIYQHINLGVFQQDNDRDFYAQTLENLSA
jgi:hypothetical protein